jgi:hypothetical protein
MQVGILAVLSRVYKVLTLWYIDQMELVEIVNSFGSSLEVMAMPK